MLYRGDMNLKMIRGKGRMTVPREHSLILCCYVSLSLSILSSCLPAPVSLSETLSVPPMDGG